MTLEIAERPNAADADAERWPPSPQRAIRRAMAYMRVHSNRRLPLAEVASVVHMSQYHFSRLFHRIVGTTFQDHLVRLRLRNAEHMLRRDPAALLRRVAAQTGFGTLRNFQDHYARVYGYPPSRGRFLAAAGESVALQSERSRMRRNAGSAQRLGRTLPHLSDGGNPLPGRFLPTYPIHPPTEGPAPIGVDYRHEAGTP